MLFDHFIPIHKAQVANMEFSPLIYSPALWVDAADISTILSDSDGVYAWQDKSGHGHYMTQAQLSERPTSDAVTINGLNALLFSSSELRSSTFNVAGLSELHIFVLARCKNSGNSELYILDQSPGSYGVGLRFDRNSLRCFAYDDTEAINMTLSDGSFTNNNHLIHYAFSNDANNASLSINGNVRHNVTLAGSSIRSPINADFVIGNATDANEYGLMDLGEIIIFDTLLTVEQVANLHDYLSNKWDTAI